MAAEKAGTATFAIKPQSDLNVLIVYLNLPFILVPRVAIEPGYGEESDEEGLRTRKYYSDIYSESLMNEYQDTARAFFGDAEGVAADDLRADFRIRPEKKTPKMLNEMVSPVVGH